MGKAMSQLREPQHMVRHQSSNSTELYQLWLFWRTMHGKFAWYDHLILLSVLNRIHCGMGLFCLAFLASFLLMRNVFWDGCKAKSGDLPHVPLVAGLIK